MSLYVHNLDGLHKYPSKSNQTFSSSFFFRIFKKTRGDQMNLKGWPFEPLDGDVKPLNGGGPGAGGLPG